MAWVSVGQLGTVLYDFKAGGKHQISVSKGEQVRVAKESSGWYKGDVVGRDATGIFPAQYVKLIGPLPPQTKSVPPPPPATSTGGGSSGPNHPPNNASKNTGAKTGVAALAARFAQAQQAQNTSPPNRPAPKKLVAHPAPQTNQPVKKSAPPPLPSASSTTTSSSPSPSPPLLASTSKSKSTPPPPPSSNTTPTPTTTASTSKSPRGPPPPPSSNSITTPAGTPLHSRTVSRVSVDSKETEVKEKKNSRSLSTIQDSKMVDMSSEAMITEIDSCITEWQQAMDSAIVSGDRVGYHEGQERLAELLHLRRLFMAGSSPELRTEIIQLIESSRKMKEGFMVVRNDLGQVADADNTSLSELLNLHRTMYSTLKEESTSLWKKQKRTRQEASIKRQIANKATEDGVSVNMLNANVEWKDGFYQLYVDIKVCIFLVGEPTECYFSLYRQDTKDFITEPHCLRLTEAGMPVDIRLLGKMKTVFKDLERQDFLGGLWLVCRIYRCGRLIFDPKKTSPPSISYRRPFGCAATCLSNVGLQGMLGEVYEPSNSAMTIYTSSEHKFHRLHQMIIAGDRNLEVAPRAKGIALEMRLYNEGLPELQEREAKLLGPDEAPPTNKLEFPEILNPGELRNDFYVFLLTGVFLQDKKSSAKNIEVFLRIFTDTGDLVPDCIVVGSGSNPPLSEYRSTVYYHSNTPSFQEALLLRIDPDLFERCHVLMTFSHVSKSARKTAIFSYTFLPLSDVNNGAVVQDFEHKLTTYKPFDKIKDSKRNTAHYLKGDFAVPALTPRKEHFILKTTLTSTKKTQNVVLHWLFKWQSIPLEKLKQNLGMFLNLSQRDVNELAMFVREAFDVFFGILQSDRHTEVQNDVFKAITHLLFLLTDKKLTMFRPLVDSYTANVFTNRDAYRLLMRLALNNLKNKTLLSSGQSLLRLSSALSYIFKMAVVSLKQDEEKTEQEGKISGWTGMSDFQQALEQVLSTVNDLLALSEEDGKLQDISKLSQSQATFISNFPNVINELAEVLPPINLGTYAHHIISSINSSHGVDGLLLVRTLLKGPVGEEMAARDIITPSVISLVQRNMLLIDSGSLTEPYLCISILQSLFGIMCRPDNFDADKFWQTHTILEDLAHMILTIQQYLSGEIDLHRVSDSVRQECDVDLGIDSLTILLSLINGLEDDRLDRWLANLDDFQLKEFMSTVLQVLITALKEATFPELWLAMNMHLLSVVGKVLTRFNPQMKSRCSNIDIKDGSFIGDDDAEETDFNIWQQWFRLSLDVFSCGHLSLEQFGEKKREWVTARYGDLRSQVIAQVAEMWAALDTRKLPFIPILVERLFDLASNYSNDLEQMGMDIYFDMVLCEFKGTKDFRAVERHTIDALYSIAHKSQEDGLKFMQLIKSRLTEGFNNQEEEVQKEGLTFLKHLERMYELMSSLLQFPNTALYEDERTSVALDLMEYLENSGHKRKQMYMRYTQYLVDLHSDLKNYAEAGMTQTLQVKMLDWDDENLTEWNGHPAETERERKERLFHSSVNMFVQAKEWEQAVARLDVLANYYQHDLFDYQKLAEVHRDQAQYFENIINNDRYYVNYFRVVYHGTGFDEAIRGNEYVYRGVQLEPVMDFTNRIKKKFPKAHVLMSSDAPSDELSAQHEQIISITTLTRLGEDDGRFEVRDEFEEKLRKRKAEGKAADATVGQFCTDIYVKPIEAQFQARVPAQVMAYRENNDLRVFCYAKADQRSPEKKPANEFKHLWVIKTYIFTEDSFPSVRRRVPVIDRKEVYLSPIENAIITMQNKNKELMEKINSVRRAPPGPVDVGPLSMNLNGMIDAAVNGGTQKYIEAFLSDEAEQTEENITKAPHLKAALREQLDFLRRGLEVFGRRKQPQLEGLYEHLQSFFAKMEKVMSDLLK